MIKVSHVYYDYPGHRALNDVSFELPPQSITALVGPNGAGKTTLLRSMAALEKPAMGTITMSGVDVWEHPREAHLLMGYLPDHFGLYQELTALQCLTYAAWAHGLRGDEAQESVYWAIEQVGLREQLPMLASSLSRGQRQRLALAQAIVHRPKILLMDEPASGLDPEARASLSSLMKSLAAQGMTLLISSHILAELEAYCTAMLVLEQGRILAYQPLGELASASHHKILVADATAQPPAPQTQMVKKMLRIGLILQQQPQLASLCQWFAIKGPDAHIKQGRYVVVDGYAHDELHQTQLLRDLLPQQWQVTEFALQSQSLQDVYMQMVANHRQAGRE